MEENLIIIPGPTVAEQELESRFSEKLTSTVCFNKTCKKSQQTQNNHGIWRQTSFLQHLAREQGASSTGLDDERYNMSDLAMRFDVKGN